MEDAIRLAVFIAQWDIDQKTCRVGPFPNIASRGKRRRDLRVVEVQGVGHRTPVGSTNPRTITRNADQARSFRG